MYFSCVLITLHGAKKILPQHRIGMIFIIIGSVGLLLVIAGLNLGLDYLNNDINNQVIIIAIIILLLGAAMTAFGFCKVYDTCSKENSIEQIEYPKSEYCLDYKVTTLGNQSDTTYVLTRIK